jgi:hypothetical protein
MHCVNPETEVDVFEADVADSVSLSHVLKTLAAARRLLRGVVQLRAVLWTTA